MKLNWIQNLNQGSQNFSFHSLKFFIFIDISFRSVTSHHSGDDRVGIGESSMDINTDGEYVGKSEVTCIVPFSRGILVAAGVNKVYMFDRIDDNREYYRRNREILIPNDSTDKINNERIVSMCLSPSEETLIVATDHQQIYQVSFSSIDITKVRSMIVIIYFF